MAKKITIEFGGNPDRHGRRFAIDYGSEGYAKLASEPTITFKIGFESFTMTRQLFKTALAELSMAEGAGAEYPEDFRGWFDR